MPNDPRIVSTWHDDAHTIIHSTMEGNMTWPIFRQGYEEALAMARSVGHDVYLITDIQPTYVVARGNAFLHVRRFYTSYPPNLHKQIIVNVNAFERAILSAFTRIYPGIENRPSYANTLDEALAMIATMKEKT
jgi:hypothetical protein